jgi:hypothetical protein
MSLRELIDSQGQTIERSPGPLRRDSVIEHALGLLLKPDNPKAWTIATRGWSRTVTSVRCSDEGFAQ